MFDMSLLELPHMRRTCALLAVALVAWALCIFFQCRMLAEGLASIWRTGGLASAIPLLAGFAGLFLAASIIEFAIDSSIDRFARARAAELQEQTLDAVFASPAAATLEHGSASLTAAAIGGIEKIESYIRVVLPRLVGLPAVAFPLLIGMYAVDWVSGVICTVMFPVIILFMVLIGKSAAARAESQYGVYKQLANHFTDTLRGLSVLRAFGAIEHEEESVYDTSEKFRRATMSTLSIATLSGAVLDLVSVFGVAAVALMLAFRLLDGSLPLEIALTALILAPEYFKPIRAFASNFHASLDGRSALSDLRKLLAISAARTADDDLRPWNASSTLELRNIAVSYPDSLPVLPHASIAFTGFEKVALIGKTGAGKSTLADVLMGFLSLEGGSIVLDGAEVSSLAQPSWQRNIAHLSQHPYLFSASIAENVALFVPDAPREKIEWALSVVGLDDLVASLPQGVDELIGEGGRVLSGGQAHRIALARILLDPDRRILIVDEPTAHLDLETEMELKERLLPLMEGRLVVFATHRLHWLADMDRIIAIDGGRIAEVSLEEARALFEGETLEASAGDAS